MLNCDDFALIEEIVVQSKTTFPAYKSGTVAAASFSGNPKSAAVVFTTAFSSASYSVIITGGDGRSWAVASSPAPTAAGFTISSQANQALTLPVYWVAIMNGESL